MFIAISKMDIPYRSLIWADWTPNIIYESKNLFGEAKGNFRTVYRRYIFYAVKHTNTTHRAKMLFHLFSVDLQTISKNFGGPNNYLFSAQIEDRYGTLCDHTYASQI
jgi:hypothetical protein